MDQIIPILISAFTGIIVAILTWKFQLRTELSKILENYVSEKKYKAYYNAVNLFYRTMSNSKSKENKDTITFQDMIKVKQDLFMYGSDESFKAFTEYLCSSIDKDEKNSFEDFLNFMIIIRKELSGGRSTIDGNDLLLNLMQSEIELQKFHLGLL